MGGKVKIEVGKSYKTRDGLKAWVNRYAHYDGYCFKGYIDIHPACWTIGGAYIESDISGLDLVSVWIDEEVAKEDTMSSEGRPAKWDCVERGEQEVDRKCATPDASEWNKFRLLADESIPKGTVGFCVGDEVKATLVNVDTSADKAKRFNKGKPEWARLQWTEIEEVVKVLTKSAHEKYFDDPAPEGSRGKPNWSKGNSYSVFWESAQRHLKSWVQGERYDAESGLPTLAHCIASCLILMNWERRGVGVDDRALSRGDE